MFFLSQSQPLRLLTLASSLLIAIDGAWFALLIIMSTSVLGLPDSAFGLLLASGAIGGLVGSATADRFPRLSLRHVTIGVFATMTVSLVGLGLHPTVVATIIVLITTSGAFAVWNVFAVTARQRATPPHLLGRVTGAYKTIVLAAASVGTLVGSLIAQLTSIETSLVLAGSLAAISTPFLWLTIQDTLSDGSTT